jgi:DNA repair protein SbcC/Rad50
VTPTLRSISISDFRSVRGPVTVPLDAPVVLIHGPNGVGKTSVLSAIELGLTGQVPSMARVDPDYVTYLPHRDATTAALVRQYHGLNAAAAALGYHSVKALQTAIMEFCEG